MPADDPDRWQRQMLRGLAVILVVGYCVAGPPLVAWYLLRGGVLAARYLFGQLGRPFGRRWFRSTRRLTWRTNFLAMPADDAALARWLAAQPDVVASSVTREPYWVVFDCVRRGYFLGRHDVKAASTAHAVALGYDTGGRVSIIDERE